MKIQIMTTYKDWKRKWGIDRRPNLDIKNINGRPFRASYEYLDDVHCKAIIEFDEVKQ